MSKEAKKQGEKRDSTTSGENNEVGPDFFGFYAREIAELLSQDEGLLSFPNPASHLVGNLNKVGREKGSTKNSCKAKENNVFGGSASLFSNGMGALLSELTKERFKLLLRQSVSTLTQEVDEIDDDLRFLLENDTKFEELIKKYSNEFSSTLHYMEQKLDELLDILMTSCRPMTIAEKQHLRKLIQNLPPRNLERVVEIIGREKPPEGYFCDEVHVVLDEMEKITLWRLYFYVTTIQGSSTK